LPELMETEPRAAAVVAKILARQAAALHVVFMRGLVDVLSNKEPSLRDVSRALKAQNQCRIALRLMLALRAVEQSQKKSRNRTNRLLKKEIPHHAQALGRAAPNVRLCPANSPPQKVGLVARTTCSTGGAAPILAAVEKVDRSANRRRQDPLHLECAQTRPQEQSPYRTEARRAPASPRLRRDNRPRQNAPACPISDGNCRRRQQEHRVNPEFHLPPVGRSIRPRVPRTRKIDRWRAKRARALSGEVGSGGGRAASNHELSQEAHPAASSPAVA